VLRKKKAQGLSLQDDLESGLYVLKREEKKRERNRAVSSLSNRKVLLPESFLGRLRRKEKRSREKREGKNEITILLSLGRPATHFGKEN